MTIEEFQILTAVEALSRESQTVMPRWVELPEILSYVEDRYGARAGGLAAAGHLLSMRRRRLVASKAIAGPGIVLRWVPTLYGSKVVSA